MKRLMLSLFLGLFLVSFAMAENSSCTENICELYEGETLSHEGYEIQIEFMDSSEVRLSIDGTILAHHFDSFDQIYSHNNSLYIILKDIAYSQRVGGPASYAVFNFTKNDSFTVCPMDAPGACGVDGVTYSNSCVASESGVEVECEGPCPCEQETVCKDEDGLNYYKKGETIIEDGSGLTLTISDTCLSEYISADDPLYDDLLGKMVNGSVITSDEMALGKNVLIEGRCPNVIPQDLSDPFPFQVAYTCPHGCNDGACIVGGTGSFDPKTYGAGELVSLGEGETVIINVRGIDYKVYLDPYYVDRVGFEINGKQDDRLAGEGELIRITPDVTIKVIEIFEKDGSGYVKFRMFFSAGGTIRDITDEIKDYRDLRYETRTDIREALEEGEEINFSEARTILQKIDEEILALQLEKMRILTRLRLHNLGNASELKAVLSNGRNATIKIMPEVAAERALARLRLKVCNETRNCSIELKEVGTGDKARLVYEARARKTFRIWGFIKNHEEVRTRIDAETGEVVETKRPWWAWMASEKDEADEN